MRSRVAVFAVILLLAPVLVRTGELSIEVRGTSVDIRVQRIPLQQVLDHLSQKTGMKVVYDTEPPQEIVTFDLRGMELRHAVTQLLHGHGLTYAVRMDPSGTRVDTVLLTHGGGGGVRASQPAPPPMMMPDQHEQQEYYEEMAEPEEPPPPPEMTPAPSPTPAAFWTPAPFPQNIPGIQFQTPPPSVPPQFEQVPPSMEGQPPPEGMPPG